MYSKSMKSIYMIFFLFSASKIVCQNYRFGLLDYLFMYFAHVGWTADFSIKLPALSDFHMPHLYWVEMKSEHFLIGTDVLEFWHKCKNAKEG